RGRRVTGQKNMPRVTLFLGDETLALLVVIPAQILLRDLDVARDLGLQDLDVLDVDRLFAHVAVAVRLVERRDVLVRDLDALEEGLVLEQRKRRLAALIEELDVTAKLRGSQEGGGRDAALQIHHLELPALQLLEGGRRQPFVAQTRVVERKR